MKLPDKIYDSLKWICLIALPALAVLYFTLAKIWGLPYGAEITATINAIALFIGTLIGVSQLSINKEESDNETK
jgi:hypothetical protein